MIGYGGKVETVSVVMCYMEVMDTECNRWGVLCGTFWQVRPLGVEILGGDWDITCDIRRVFMVTI